MRKVLVLVAAALVPIVAAAVFAQQLRRRQQRSAQRATSPANVGFMYAMHHAFRRDLGRLERAVVDPASSRAGWNVFREELEFHHRAEDDDLWPSLRARVNDASDLAVIDDMIAEHAQITPALEAVACGFDGRADYKDAVDALAALVRTHLDHEEHFALPIVERHFSDGDWHEFLRTERRKRGRKGEQFLCWVLDDADAEDAGTVLAEVPALGRLAYRDLLQPRYEARRLWPPQVSVATGVGQ
jgi:hypothetical protein